ncbi:MAG: hypothetical protein VB064_13960 [Oscillospiraceae bacterium]|nr:hypothetical protein [Oscillospiraceae bacterium]
MAEISASNNLRTECFARLLGRCNGYPPAELTMERLLVAEAGFELTNS